MGEDLPSPPLGVRCGLSPREKNSVLLTGILYSKEIMLKIFSPDKAVMGVVYARVEETSYYLLE